MIEIKELTKRYHRRTVVDSLNITVQKGELYGFLGPNGAGKTTTIRMMTGLLMPDNGSITIDGHHLMTDPMAAKNAFGYIPDQPFLYDRLTPREFLRFIGGIYNMSVPECDRKIDEWLDRFDLTDFQNELLGAFSHGMRQKVAFAAALIHDPGVLIIDEPMVGLDPKGALILKSLLRSLCEKGLTAFISTHSLDVAEEIADRIGILYQGKLVAEGTMDELRDRLDSRKDRLEEIFLELTRTDASEFPFKVNQN